MGVLVYADLSLTELTEEPLLVMVLSKSMFLNLEVSEGLGSNSLAKDTLKMESVGTLGVERSNPP